MNPLGVDKIICLCLDKREELWRKLESQCLEKGWDFQAFICGDGKMDLKYDLIDDNVLPPKYRGSINYPSWWARPNAFNAWHAHWQMIQTCLRKGYKSALFLEDDVTFFSDFDEKLRRVEEALKVGPDNWVHNWDMVYLGNFIVPDEGLDDTPIIRVGGRAGGWHAVALRENVMKDLHNTVPLGPMDWICQQYIQPNYQCYAAMPPLMRQIGTFSYVENHYLGRREEDNYQ